MADEESSWTTIHTAARAEQEAEETEERRKGVKEDVSWAWAWAWYAMHALTAAGSTNLEDFLGRRPKKPVVQAAQSNRVHAYN